MQRNTKSDQIRLCFNLCPGPWTTCSQSLLSAQWSLNIFTPSCHAQTLDPLLREYYPWCIQKIIQCVLHTYILVSRKNHNAAWSIEYVKQVTCCQSAHFCYISLLYLHLVQFFWKKKIIFVLLRLVYMFLNIFRSYHWIVVMLERDLQH